MASIRERLAARASAALDALSRRLKPTAPVPARKLHQPPLPPGEVEDPGFDSIYFFLWPGWRNETDSNRWHYARRWAKRLPVVMILPEIGQDQPWAEEPDPRIENTTILSTVESSWSLNDIGVTGMRQLSHVADFMAAKGHKRPLFWCYNPSLIFAFTLLPAAGRVYHGTENYFDFENLTREWLHLLRATIDMSDAVIACSSGVAAGYVESTGRKDIHVVNNGCEFARYNQPGPRPDADWARELEAQSEAGERIVMFAGRINGRLNVEMLRKLARVQRGTKFWFIGPVVRDGFTKKGDWEAWETLTGYQNVYLGPQITPDEIAWAYSKADVGIIPYKLEPWLVHNGFPLKALEMAAAGLPVVSSRMDPLREVPDAVQLAEADEEFIEKVKASSRKYRSAEEAERSLAQARAHDYNVLFERARLIASEKAGENVRPGDLRALMDRFGRAQYARMFAGAYPYVQGSVRSDFET